MTAAGKVLCEETHGGRRLRIVLRAGRGNVIDAAVAAALADALAGRTGGRSLRCVTLAAEGPHFSYGASVPEHEGERARRLLEALDRAVHALLHLDVPLLAAVRGSCLGGGLELVLPCHRIFAAPDARLGLPEVTLGMFAPAGSALLPERVRRGLAEEMLLTGRILGAAEALAAGLVDEVAADPEAAATGWFETNLLDRSATALRAATRASRATLVGRVSAALRQLEALFLDGTVNTRDAREGIASFAERRKPQWADA